MEQPEQKKITNSHVDNIKLNFKIFRISAKSKGELKSTDIVLHNFAFHSRKKKHFSFQMKVLYLLLVVALAESRFIEFENRCGYDIWVNPLTNAQGPPLGGGIRRLANYERYTYQIPDGGWYVQHFDY